MKIMEILKLWVRCVAAASEAQKNPIALRTLVILARAAQEYNTSGLHTKDIIDEISNADSHPYIYDGAPHKPRGLAKIIGKYNIKNPYIRVPESLSDALNTDIYRKILTQDGNVDYTGANWLRSRVLITYCNTICPHDGLPLALGRMLAAARQK